ncbi:MAG: DUF4292 domain-containing protein, partial [bacterium]
MRSRLLILLFVSITLYSCSSSKVGNNSSEITFEEIKQRVNENAMKLKSVDAAGEISIDSPNMSNTGSITISILKPDSIYTKLEGPFGIDIADLLITRNDFVYYNASENKVIRGPSSQKNLGIIMRIKLEFDDILNAFSGKFIFSNENFKDAKITSEESNYVVSLTYDNEIRKYWIDSENYFVTKLITTELDGSTKVEITYDDFFESDNIFFPKRVYVTRP